MASWAGALGQEVGGMMQERSADMREERMKDEDYAREQQLAKQRMAHDSSLLERRLSAEDARQQRMVEAENALEKSRQEFETGYREEDREAGMAEAELKAQTDILTTAMRVYASQSESGMVRGNDWTTKVEQTIDPQTGQFIDTLYATHNGRTYTQQGDKMFDAGAPAQAFPFESIDQQRAAESELHNGKYTAEEFKDVFGYVPASYVFGEVSKGSDFGSFLKKNSIRIPMFGIGDDDRRGGPRSGDRKVDRMYREQGVTSADYPMRPPIEDVSEGPERDANIAEKGGTNRQLTEGYRATGAPAGTFADGSYLSQGQAATGEMPAPLETGGQMGPEAPSAQVAATAPGGELDDAGAAEVSGAIANAFGKIAGQSPALQSLKESFEPRQSGVTSGSNQ